MSLALGLRSAQQVYSIGSKLALAHSLGKKLGKLGSSAYNSLKGSSVKKGMETNNMIENKNTLGDVAYIPMGVKKIADEPKKKSYLEKR